MNTTESSAISIETEYLTVPTSGNITPSGYSQSKKVTITYASGGVHLFKPEVAGVKSNVNVTKCKSSNNGQYDCALGTVSKETELTANTWYMVSGDPTLTFTKNGSVAFKIVDGINYKNGASATVSDIDTTKPTGVSASKIKSTTNSLTIQANGVDEESPELRYQFKIDNEDWLPSEPQESNQYTFKDLTSGKHNVQVKVYNGTYASKNNVSNAMNTTESAIASLETGTLKEPTSGNITPTGYAQSKKVTITYTGEGVHLFRPTVAGVTGFMSSI